MIKTKPFDPAEFLVNEGTITAYIEEAFESGDAGFIAQALGDVARARGMTDVAERAGLARESLYRSLKRGSHVEFATIIKVMHALGLRIAVEPEKAHA